MPDTWGSTKRHLMHSLYAVIWNIQKWINHGGCLGCSVGCVLAFHCCIPGLDPQCQHVSSRMAMITKSSMVSLSPLPESPTKAWISFTNTDHEFPLKMEHTDGAQVQAVFTKWFIMLTHYVWKDTKLHSEKKNTDNHDYTTFLRNRTNTFTSKCTNHKKHVVFNTNFLHQQNRQQDWTLQHRSFAMYKIRKWQIYIAHKPEAYLSFNQYI